MVGAALDENVAGLEQHLALVHQRIDFAGEHYGIVDRAGLMEAGVTRRAAIERRDVTGAVVAGCAFLRQRGEALAIRRILDDAEHRAVPRRHQPERMVGDLGAAAIVGGRGARLPQLGDKRAAGAAAIDMRRGAIHDENRAAAGVVAGHHPADRLRHIAGHTRRSTIMRLISAMALAGLRSLGQALAQFKMVWQR